MSESGPPFPHAPSPSPITPARWDGGGPVIVDQRALPARLMTWRLGTVDGVVDAIASLAVRRAPEIRIAGAYGMVLGLLNARVTREAAPA